MSTSTFNWNDAAFTPLGFPDTTAFGNIANGGKFYYAIGIQGTNLAVRIFGTQTCDVYVDGVKTTLTGSGGGFNYIAHPTTFADAWHDVYVYPVFWNQGFAGDDGAIQATGASPAVRAICAAQILPAAFASNHVVTQGEYLDDATAGFRTQPQAGAPTDFVTSAIKLVVVYRDDSGSLTIVKDGDTASPVATVSSLGPANGDPNLWNLAVITLPGGTHTYSILPIDVPQSAVSLIVPELRFFGFALGVGETTTTGATAKTPMFVYGDSNAIATDNPDVRDTFGFILAAELGYAPVLKGNPSQLVHTYLETNTAQVTAASNVSSPAIIILQGGRNDTTDTGVTTGEIQTSYLNMATAIRTGDPSAKIVVMSVPQRKIAEEQGNSYVRLDAVNVAIQAAFTDFADANSLYVDVSPGFDPDTMIIGTTPHYNLAGQTIVATNLFNALNPSDFLSAFRSSGIFAW